LRASCLRSLKGRRGPVPLRVDIIVYLLGMKNKLVVALWYYYVYKLWRYIVPIRKASRSIDIVILLGLIVGLGIGTGKKSPPTILAKDKLN
jgi:hypothetical protein